MQISSSMLALSNCPANITLGIGARISCNASYTVTQADIEAGLVELSARGSSPSLPVAAQVVSDSKLVPVDLKPQLVVDIQADTCVQSGNTCEMTAAPSCYALL